MSLIGKKIENFTAQAYQNEEFREVNFEKDFLGTWNVVVFYPADFTFVCPTELEDLADNYEAFKKLNAEDHEHIERSLKSVGMWDQRNKRIGDLSGGQKQRICLARIFATDPDLFVLDEPTAGMDKASRERFYHLLHHACAHHGKAILMVTHEEEALEQYVDKHIHLQRKEDSPWRCFSMVSCKEHSSQE